MNTIEYAIKMEQDGEKYYKEQAIINQDNSLSVVCNMLADEEKKHAQILQDKLNKLPYKLEMSEILKNTNNIFKDLANIMIAGKVIPSQLDFYRISSDMEKQSIDLYKEFLSKATNADEIKLFEYLIMQENQHYEILDDLSQLLNRPVEWVESAEFGLREEY